MQTKLAPTRRGALFLEGCRFGLLIFICAHIFLPSAFAGWDISSLRPSGSQCLTRESLVDESKLNVKFSSFGLSLSSLAGSDDHPFAACSLSIQYRLPAGRNFKSLTQRILMKGSKSVDSLLKLTATVWVNGVSFVQSGLLGVDSSYSGGLLLYKSYDLANATECSAEEKIIDVRAHWMAELEKTGPLGHASVSLSEDADGVDLWLEEQSCAY